MYKTIITLLCLFLAYTFQSVSAQPRRKPFSPQDFVRKLESFIVQEACLTPAESTAFFPIFHEMHDKQRGINWQIRELKKRTLPANAADKEYYNLICEINKLKIELAEVEDSYYKKMCKAIPAKKVHEAMKAEDRFHRRMLRNFSNRTAKKQAPPPAPPSARNK